MAYDVHLDIFEGPLDLLLYLTKKNDLEISEIPIADITSEYLAVLEAMKDLNLEIAGDFLVMASTLMQIKARMLLPRPEGEEEEGESPLDELKARLLEYQKFKEVAQLLGNKEVEYSNIYYRPAPFFDKSDFTLEVSIYDLITSFREVLTELPTNVKEIVYEEIPIEEKIREILDILEGKQFLSFIDLLKTAHSRLDLIVTFLAVLELTRLRQIVARQKELFGEVRIYKVTTPVEPASQEPELFAAEVIEEAKDGQEVLDFSKNETLSNETAANEVIPDETMQDETAVNETIPVETITNEIIPDQAASQESAIGDGSAAAPHAEPTEATAPDKTEGEKQDGIN